MRKVFVSYARQNKPAVEQLVEHLRVLGCDTWHDSSLHGGQDWWEEILGRIAECETFIAIISRDALNSTACRREFDWAEAAAAYTDFRDGYRDVAKTLGFEGHITLAEAMP